MEGKQFIEVQFTLRVAFSFFCDHIHMALALHRIMVWWCNIACTVKMMLSMLLQIGFPTFFGHLCTTQLTLKMLSQLASKWYGAGI